MTAVSHAMRKRILAQAENAEPYPYKPNEAFVMAVARMVEDGALERRQLGAFK